VKATLGIEKGLQILDYAEKSPFAVFGFWPFGAPKNGSKKLIEN